MPFEKGNKYRFTKDRQPTKRGGPVKLSSQIRNIPKDAQQRMYAILYQATTFNNKTEALNYLKAEQEKGEYGFILELAIASLAGRNGWQVLMDILDRLFGKPKQVTENYNENNDNTQAVVIFSNKDGDSSEQ